MKCDFCHQEMEDEEKLVDFHICPPERTISLNDIYAIMDEIVDSEEGDGWEAFIILRERLGKRKVNNMNEQLIKAQREQIESLRADKNRLLTALELLIGALSRTNGDDTLAVKLAKKNARAAIAKARKEAVL